MRCLHTDVITAERQRRHSGVELYCRSSTSQSWTVPPGVCRRLHLLFQPPASSGSEPSASREDGWGSAGVRTRPRSTAGQQRGTEKQTSHNAAAAAELQGASVRRHLRRAGLSTFGSHARVSEHASSLSECAPVHVGARFGRGDWGAAGQRG